MVYYCNSVHFFGNIYDKKAHKLFDNMTKLTHWNDKGITVKTAFTKKLRTE